jgi:hypothetical protein
MAAVKTAAKKGNLAKLPAVIFFQTVTTEINRKTPGGLSFRCHHSGKSSTATCMKSFTNGIGQPSRWRPSAMF